MSSDLDFSKFLRSKSESTQPNKESELDFSQYKRKSENQSPSAYETLVERPVQIAGQSAVAGFRSIPRTGYDLLKTVVSSTGGNISKLEEAEQNAPEWLKAFSKSAFPTYEEIRSEQASREGEDKLAQPEGSVEKGIEKFGRFLGEAPALGGVGGAKGIASLAGLAGGMQIGEESKLGPVGTLLTGALGSLAPGGIASGVKALRSPTKLLAKGAAKMTPTKSLELRKEIIKNARDAGVQLDIGSLTNSGALKWIQNQLAQSPFTGKALDEFKSSLTKQVVDEYKGALDLVGKASLGTRANAGEALQGTLTKIKDADLASARKLYEGARARGGDFQVFTGPVVDEIVSLESKLTPGSLKGGEQNAVLKVINDLKNDVMTPQGGIKSASINELINNKIALNDIINWEVQGGAKQLLKGVSKSLDDAIMLHGKQDPAFAKLWKDANTKFADHAKTFRENKNIASSLRTQNPEQVFQKMSTVQGIRDVKKALSKSAEGRELFKDLSRFKLDDLLEKSVQKNAQDVIQFGKVGNIFKNPRTKDLIKELSTPEAYKRLEKLTGLSNQVAESANKFLNTSQSGTTVTNVAAIVDLLKSVGSALSGNFLPLMRTSAQFGTAISLSKLITNESFLIAVEDAILASKSNNATAIKKAGEKLLEVFESTARGSGEANEDKNP